MRRRIYTDRWESGDHEDVTTDFHMLVDRDMSYRPTPKALYDEDVWQRYQDALAAVRAARLAVYAATVEEPLDDVELGLIAEYEVAEQKLDAIAGDDGAEDEDLYAEFDRTNALLEERALAHARTRTRPLP